MMTEWDSRRKEKPQRKRNVKEMPRTESKQGKTIKEGDENSGLTCRFSWCGSLSEKDLWKF